MNLILVEPWAADASKQPSGGISLLLIDLRCNNSAAITQAVHDACFRKSSNHSPDPSKTVHLNTFRQTLALCLPNPGLGHFQNVIAK